MVCVFSANPERYSCLYPFLHLSFSLTLRVFFQVGELLGKIENDNPMRRFQGYTDQAATEKKIARNVIAKGDEYFRTGDLVMRDKEGFVYFIDRIGDTFRWKGENVSTAGKDQTLVRPINQPTNSLHFVCYRGVVCVVRVPWCARGERVRCEGI